LQALGVSSDGRTLSWTRGGASPLLNRVTFEVSAQRDGPWTLLGHGVRKDSGWELKGQRLPFETIRYLRARGYYSSGMFNGSGSMQETVRLIYLPRLEDELCAVIRAVNNAVIMFCL
jgi:hypothetical protein